LDDVDEISRADSDARAGAEFATQMRFRFITGSSGEPEEYSDECVDLDSWWFCLSFLITFNQMFH